jgi:hypothetical protein
LISLSGFAYNATQLESPSTLWNALSLVHGSQQPIWAINQCLFRLT